jgi:hypothetical protein
MSAARAWGALAVAGIALAIYAATLSPNLAAAHDAVVYMNLIDGAEPAFHPHHLLFAPLAQLWIAALRQLGSSADSSGLVALLDACAGAAGLGLVYALLRSRASLDAPLAAAATLCAGASFGFWFYSVSVEVYLIPLALVLAALYALEGNARVERRFALAGALQGLAVLFHELHLLFLPTVIWAAWRAGRAVPGACLRALGVHALVFVPVVGGVYAAVMLAEGVDTLAGALRFAAGYAIGHDYWVPPSLATLPRALLGAGRSLVGAHFLFAVPPLRDALTRTLPDQGLVDEVYLVRGLGAPLAWALLAGALALGAGLVALAARGLAQRKGMNASARSLGELAAVWLASYTAFFLFWVPHNVEFWIPQCTALWLLLACAWSTASAHGARAFAALGAALLALNYVGSIRPVGARENDYYYAQTQPFAALATPRDLIVVGDRWIFASYLERFARAPVWSLARTLRASATPREAVYGTQVAIDRTLAAGGRVLVSADALEPDTELRRALGESGILALAELWVRHPARTVARDGALAPLHVIEGASDAPPSPDTR